MEAVPPINKCSGTDELASSWFCSECDISGKGFETCFGHLKTHALQEELGFKKLSDLLPLVYSSDEILSEETTMKDLQEAIDSTLSEYLESYKEVVVQGPLGSHLEQNWETDDYHAGVTAVLWDIKRCPVPPDCDARLVGPCITRYFEDLGYSGPINIYAFGQLTDVPDDVLRAVSSTGISLNHITFKTDSADIMHLMARWTCLNPLPATIMFICPYSTVSKDDMNHLKHKWGCHVIKQFTYDSPGSQSYFGNFLRLEDYSGTLAEDKCSETGEHASWACLVCNISGKGFENFTMHLKTHALEEELSDLLPPVYSSDEIKEEDNLTTVLSEETTMKDLQEALVEYFRHLYIDATLSECHERYNEVVVDGVPDSLDYHLEQQWKTDDYHVGVTAVLWDIKRCPVPPDCDARLVGPCITRYFEDLGYSGPINIYAFGQLTDVPDDVLQAVSSTGISLNHITFKTDSADIMHLMARWTCLNPLPATIMFICPYSTVSKNDMNHLEEKWGCHVIKQFTYDSPGSQSSFGNFFRLEDDSGTLAEDKCSETGEHASWACLVCNISGKDFENFTMHLKTHALEEEETLAEHFGHVHIVATPSVCHERHYKEVVEAGVEEASLDSHPENATTMVKKQQ